MPDTLPFRYPLEARVCWTHPGTGARSGPWVIVQREYWEVAPSFRNPTAEARIGYPVVREAQRYQLTPRWAQEDDLSLWLEEEHP